MKKTTLGLIAGAAGVALLAGGGTFALWGDNAQVDGGQITNGDLAIASTGGQWADVSHPGVATTIDPASFRAVPGDQLELTQKATIVATGDNMNAALTASGGSSAESLAAKGLSATYSIYKGQGASLTPVSGGSNVPLGTPANISIPKTTADGDVYTIKVDANFDAATGGRVDANEVSEIGNITFQMNQVRG